MSLLAIHLAAERRLVDARKNVGWKQSFSFPKDLNAKGRVGRQNPADGPLQLGRAHLGAGLFLGTDPQARTEE